MLDAFTNSKWTNLSVYIKNEIKKNNWRIKADNILQVPLGELNAIKGINQNKEIYRYDCKEKMMYFNHKESNQEKLNSMITKALEMSREVVDCKIEKKERGMGGMGMGGMMGMMGMMGRRGM